MKRILVTLISLAVATVTLAKDFEGKLEMSMTARKKTTPMSYFIKSGKVRFEMTSDGKTVSVGLVNPDTGDITILMPEQKMFMSIPGKTVGAAMPDLDFKETGRTETIAGKACSEFVVTEKKNVIEIWATSELGGVANMAEAFSRRGQRSAWEQEMIRRNLFALRVITKNKKGVEQSRMECTTITPEKLDDALFEIPEGYSKLPGLGDLLGR